MSSEKPPTITPARTSVTGVTRPAPVEPKPDGAGSPPKAFPGPVSAAVRTADPTVPVAPGAPISKRLTLSRVDPWSVMKLSFLLSVAAGIMLVVATWIVWEMLDSLAVFTQINDAIAVLAGRDDFFDLLEYVARDRVISLATMVGVADVVVLTALSTIGAFLYNIVAKLVGGIHVTLTDD